MLCQKCKMREATGYMEQTVNGVKSRLYVCPECFKQAQLEMFSSLPNLGLFSGLNGGTPRLKCSKCGTTLRDISDTCFVGCPYCYEELGENIKPIIRNIQSAVMHIGSGPSEEVDETAILKQQLEDAIAQENYEKAAELQARIKHLKGENP